MPEFNPKPPTVASFLASGTDSGLEVRGAGVSRISAWRSGALCRDVCRSGAVRLAARGSSPTNFSWQEPLQRLAVDAGEAR